MKPNVHFIVCPKDFNKAMNPNCDEIAVPNIQAALGYCLGSNDRYPLTVLQAITELYRIEARIAELKTGHAAITRFVESHKDEPFVDQWGQLVDAKGQRIKADGTLVTP